MHTHVLSEIRLASKRPPALFALEALLAAVRKHMNLQVAHLSRFLAAHITFEQLLLGVLLPAVGVVGATIGE